MALEFCILTAARSGEVLGAQWSEFELFKTIPPHITDEPMIAQLKKIGFEPGKSFDLNKADPTIQRALATAPVKRSN